MIRFITNALLKLFFRFNAKNTHINFRGNNDSFIFYHKLFLIFGSHCPFNISDHIDFKRGLSAPMPDLDMGLSGSFADNES